MEALGKKVTLADTVVPTQVVRRGRKPKVNEQVTHCFATTQTNGNVADCFLQAKEKEKEKEKEKAKAKADQDITKVLDDALAEDNTNGVAGANSKKSRRGRKPKVVYNGFENVETLQMLSDDENVIMKLNVNNQQMLDDQSVVDEDTFSVPDAYNVNDACNAFSKPVDIGTFESMDIDIDSYYNTDVASVTQPGLKVVNLLKDFEEKNKNDEWPSNTSIVCYWCCHRFENAPFGIPVKYTNEKFHVYGCFCSLECAASYNLASKESIDEMWERYNLINLLSRRIGYSLNYIKPAPNRLALKMFGGYLSIEEFRRYTQTNKLVNINFPPMMTMTQQIEEINESDINNDYKYIPLDTDRINKYKEKIKLKRTKPLHDFKNTLDHAMNLKFGA